MPERTHPTQQDEHLRRAIGPSPDARAVLDRLANQFRTVRSNGNLDEARRLGLILRYADDQRPDSAEELEREVQRYAPRITDPITRGEYALVLDRAIRSAR